MRHTERYIALVAMEPDLTVVVATQMLAAITCDSDDSVESIVETATLEEQMRFLRRYIDTVSKSDKFDIGRVLLLNNQNNSIVSCNEGVVIDMDKIPPHVVGQMYTMLKTKIEKMSK